VQLLSNEELLESEPENCPQFCELVSTISSILESVAGYLELAMWLQDDKPEFQGSETRADDDKNGIDAWWNHKPIQCSV